MLDARTSPGDGDRFIASRVAAAHIPIVVVLNKVDGLKPEAIGVAIERAAGLVDFHSLHPISALTGDGLSPLLTDLFALLPGGPAYFDSDTVSDQPIDFLIGELIREQALAITREEVPHAIAIAVDEHIKPTRRKAGRVTAALVVETDSQARILVGKGGGNVRAIGEGARPEIEQLLGGRIYLDLRVKVRPNWRRDSTLLDRYGL